MLDSFALDMNARIWSERIGAFPDRAQEFYDRALSGDLAGLRALLTRYEVPHTIDPRPVITGVTNFRSSSDKG